MFRNLVVFIVGIMPFLAIAQESHSALEKTLLECKALDSYARSYPCAKKVFEKADQSLNIQYKNLIGYLQNEHKEKLKLAERNWIAFRDSDCDFSAPESSSDDLMYKSNRSYCMAEKTLSRLKELEQYNSWKGCNGCPW